MSDWLVLAGILVVATSGIPGLFADRRGRACERYAAAAMVGGGVLGIAGALLALARGGSPGLAFPWGVPEGVFEVKVDALSALFLVQVFLLAGCGATYGLAYWRQADHPATGRKLRVFYGALTAGMALLAVARHGLLFLAGWEVMALCAFLAFTAEDRDRLVREAGYVYLASTRVGTLCLFAAFGVLYTVTGSFRFFALPAGTATGAAGTAVFALAAVGFGIKAGVMPLHLWLPGAHANAPTHVSAVMSGVLIKTGIYGLFRVTSLFPDPPLWWGGTLLAAGAVSGVAGVAFAIGQHDLKRLLAYHSVENIGIICLGLGLALVGRTLGRPELVVLGVAGGALHVLNHGLFKALLFLSAGAVVHALGTRELDAMGGLLKRMRWSGLAFLAGAVAICGLPPLNGFVSELFVYLGLGRTLALPGPVWMAGAVLAAALAFIGGLALACFAKVFGAVFLGEPRTERAGRAHEAPAAMLAPMGVLAAGCVAIGLFPALVAPALELAARAWAPELDASLPRLGALAPLGMLSVGAAALLLAVAVLAWVLRRAARAAPRELPTWDCGYAAPSPRMQYTASSFADTLVGLFAFLLRPRARRPHLTGAFPREAHFHSEVPEVVLDLWIRPALATGARVSGWFRWFQRGSVQAYLVYVLLTLLMLLLCWG